MSGTERNTGPALTSQTAFECNHDFLSESFSGPSKLAYVGGYDRSTVLGTDILTIHPIPCTECTECTECDPTLILPPCMDRMDDQWCTILLIGLACTGRRCWNNTVEALEFRISVLTFLACLAKISFQHYKGAQHYIFYCFRP